jgi:hypothetical protein
VQWCNGKYYANGMARQTASRHGNARGSKATARLPLGRVEEMAMAGPPKLTDRSIIARRDQQQASAATIADLAEGNCRRADVN